MIVCLIIGTPIASSKEKLEQTVLLKKKTRWHNIAGWCEKLYETKSII